MHYAAAPEQDQRMHCLLIHCSDAYVSVSEKSNLKHPLQQFPEVTLLHKFRVRVTQPHCRKAKPVK